MYPVSQAVHPVMLVHVAQFVTAGQFTVQLPPDRVYVLKQNVHVELELQFWHPLEQAMHTLLVEFRKYPGWQLLQIIAVVMQVRQLVLQS